MAHGITLKMRAVSRPAPTYVHEHPPLIKVGKLFRKPAGMTPYRGASRDRGLPGKARIQARREPKWIALDICPCGRRAELLEGATAEEQAAFDRASEDHGVYCEYAR